jgi:hypothetical protein
MKDMKETFLDRINKIKRIGNEECNVGVTFDIIFPSS